MRFSPWLAKLVLQQSPKHAKAAWEARRDGQVSERSDAKRFGSCVDRIVFQVGEDIVVKTKRGQKEDPGQILVSESELERANKVAAAVLEQVPRLSSIHSKNQHKIIWNDRGLECSASPDNMDMEQWQINDLKTSHDMSDDGIVKAIEMYGYDVQAAACIESALLKLEWPRPTFRFIFAESHEPFDVRVIEMDNDMIDGGLRLWNKAKNIWRNCLQTGEFPGRGHTTVSNSRYRKGRESVDAYMEGT